MNPYEVTRGVRFINDSKESAVDRVEAYRLLAEFHRIAGGFVPELRDLAMQEILKDESYTHKVKRPHPNNHHLWEDFPLHRDEDAFTGNRRNRTQGAGLPPVIGEKMLDIDTVAQYIMHHGRLGGTNATHGVAMNFAMQADRRSVFGYSLGRALGPRSTSARPDFMRAYGCVVALPGYYREAIDIWNVTHPNRPFVEHSGDTLTIQPFDGKEVSGLTQSSLVDHLILHGIPCSWIDHAYTFGLHHLNHQSHIQIGPFHDLYYRTDRERIERLDRFGIPAAIPQWDGWWSPDYHDITRIQSLMNLEEDGTLRSCLQDFEWLPIGTPAIFRELTGPALRNNPASTRSTNLIGTIAGPSTQPVVSTGT
jgi:hypothetical protein